MLHEFYPVCRSTRKAFFLSPLGAGLAVGAFCLGAAAIGIYSAVKAANKHRHHGRTSEGSATMRRGSTKVSPVPEGTQTGPKVLLIDKYSASDGDLFPWRFKANNLGTVIGTRTWGGIVGISGPLPYIDGTDVRVPFFTNYDAKTGEWIVENYGVEPDIYVDNDPVQEFSGKDQQLEKAIEVALEQLKDRKPLPGVPAPRTFKDLGLPQPDDSK